MLRESTFLNDVLKYVFLLLHRSSSLLIQLKHTLNTSSYTQLQPQCLKFIYTKYHQNWPSIYNISMEIWIIKIQITYLRYSRIRITIDTAYES